MGAAGEERAICQTSARAIGNARRFLDFLMIEHLRQAGKRNGFLLAPYRQLYEFGVGAHFVAGAIAEAEDAGLVDCKRGTGRRPNHYALTWLPLADGAAPSNRWSGVHAVSTENACQTACTRRVANAKQHARGPNIKAAKQHAPSRSSIPEGRLISVLKGLGKTVERGGVFRPNGHGWSVDGQGSLEGTRR
jgi:hypothetical protein